MDFVQRFLNEKGYQITQDLVGKLGFSTEQAKSFLPTAVRKLVGAFQGGKLDITSLMGGGDPSLLLDKIDAGALAGELGLEEREQARDNGVLTEQYQHG